MIDQRMLIHRLKESARREEWWLRLIALLLALMTWSYATGALRRNRPQPAWREPNPPASQGIL